MLIISHYAEHTQLCQGMGNKFYKGLNVLKLNLHTPFFNLYFQIQLIFMCTMLSLPMVLTVRAMTMCDM